MQLTASHHRNSGQPTNAQLWKRSSRDSASLDKDEHQSDQAFRVLGTMNSQYILYRNKKRDDLSKLKWKNV